MEREDTKDSSTFYDSNDDDDLDDNEDDDVEITGNDSTHTEEDSKISTLMPSQHLPKKTTKPEKSKKKGGKKRRGRVVANLAGTKFSIREICSHFQYILCMKIFALQLLLNVYISKNNNCRRQLA